MRAAWLIVATLCAWGQADPVVRTPAALTSGAVVVGGGNQNVAVSSLTGSVLKSTSGVLSAATPGTDYVIPAGNVATATALAANGTNCSAGSYPLGVDASGNAESCTAAATGTVTSVSVTTANGVSGTVATASSTPAITLTLGAITPSSVAATGTVTGSNLSGTNTGDQTNISGNAGTATALASAPTNCSSNQPARGIAASGNANCMALSAAVAKSASGVFSAATTADVSGVSYVAGGGTAQAQTATLSPALAAMAAGVQVCWLPLAANTGAAPTLAVNGLTATNITKFGTVALVANDITTTAVACVIHDGTRWQLQNPQTNNGTVTSVGFTGGLISVATSTTTPALTVAGTSGGIPYFSGTSTWASSGALAANKVVLGGGAGVAPSTSTLTASVVSASSGVLSAATTTGSGSVVLGTSPTIATPTITTSATAPLVIGGTGTTSTLTLRSTSGVGATGADIIFQAGNNGATELMRLQNGGNIGIKTASPQVTLHAINGTQITAVPGSGTYGGPVIIGNDNTLYGMYIGSISTGAGYIQQQRGDSAVTYPLLLQPNGDNVLIGYTTSNGAYKLQVNSQIFATSSTIATSDANYKTDVADITQGLDVIERLKPVTFNWKKHPVHDFDIFTRQIGFLAQDVKLALKDQDYADSVVKKNKIRVGADDEEFFGMVHNSLLPLVVKSIQELADRVRKLEAGGKPK